MKYDTRKKKGQTSVFVVLAVIILAIVVIYFFVQDNSLNQKGEEVNPQVEPIYSFVENCLKETGEGGIIYVSERGGYYEVPEISFEYEIPYYLYKKENYMPSKKIIEKEIGKYIQENLDVCLRNFSDFSDFRIDGGDREIKVSIEDEKVVFDIDFPLDITRGDKVFSFRYFNFDVDVRLGVIYDSIDEFMQEHMNHPSNICLACLHGISTREDLYVRSLDLDEGVKVFIFIDQELKINNEDFGFSFANKYEGGNINV